MPFPEMRALIIGHIRHSAVGAQLPPPRLNRDGGRCCYYGEDCLGGRPGGHAGGGRARNYSSLKTFKKTLLLMAALSIPD